MSAKHPTEIPNPFAVQRRVNRGRGRKAVVSALKVLLIAAIGLGMTAVIGSQSRQWLVSHLSSGFEDLSPTEKQQRLAQLHELGSPAAEPIAQALTDRNIEVARFAYDLLRQSQNDWITLERAEFNRRQLALVDALGAIGAQIPDDRTGWISNLLQQAMVESVDRHDEQSQQLYQAANRTLVQLSLSERGGPSVLRNQPSMTDGPVRLTVRSHALPVPADDSQTSWTDWPPPKDAPTTVAGVIADRDGSDSTTNAPTGTDDPAPSLYRSAGASLRPVANDENVELEDINQPQETSYQSPTNHQSTVTTSDMQTDESQAAESIRPVMNLVDSPLETYDIHSIIHWLGSHTPQLRQKAREELIRRGLSNEQITMATNIAAGDVPTKLRMIDVIARSPSVEPKSWLLLLMKAPEREVRIRAVTVLGTMNDPTVTKALQAQLAGETDVKVAARIRRVLNLR